MTPEEDETSAEPTKTKRLTEAEWTEAKALFEAGRATKTMLAEKYGVSRQAISAGMAARGAVYGSKTGMIEKAALEAQKDLAAKQVEEIQAFKQSQKQMVTTVQKLAVKAVMDKVRDSKPIADAKADVTTLRLLMNTIRMGRDEMYHLYDLHRDPEGAEELEEFIVSEYAQDEIDEINRERIGISADADAQLAEVEASLETNDTSEDELDALLRGD